MMRWRERLAVGLLAAALGTPAPAQEAIPPSREMRDAYAFLLGLTTGTARPVVDGEADIYTSMADAANAPRYVVRMEISGNWCRVRTISALQFPGDWAVMTLKMVDLAKVRSAVGYATVDDLIAETNPLDVHDPRARQVVLTGEGLECSSRLALDETKKSPPDCGNRIDLSMMDQGQVEAGRKALELAAITCNIEALRK